MDENPGAGHTHCKPFGYLVGIAMTRLSARDSAMMRFSRKGSTCVYATLNVAIADLDGVAVGFNSYVVVLVRSIDGTGSQG